MLHLNPVKLFTEFIQRCIQSPPTVFPSTIGHAFLWGAVTVLVASAASIDELLAGLSTLLKVEHPESGTAWPRVRWHNAGRCVAHTVFTYAIKAIHFHSQN